MPGSHMSHAGHEHSAESQQRVLTLWLLGAFLGGALVLNSFIASYVWRDANGVEGISALIGAILLSLPILWGVARDLVRGERHFNDLVALAIVACFAQGNYQTAGVVAFVMLLADMIEHRTALGAREAITHLMRLSPKRARLITDAGVELEIDSARLKPGDNIRLRPGDYVAADGEITDGNSTIDEATITGESLPADKGVGDQVFAGTINLTGAVVVRVVRAGEDTTLGRVRELILDAEKTKIPVMTLIDQYAYWYTPIVIMVAAIIYIFTKDPNRAITAMVVTCPCAFILATPTAMVAALSSAARLGILVKDVSHLEAAGKLTAIAFDKTGTLTTGRLAVTALRPAAGVNLEELVTLAASAERHSNHPAAKAVFAVAKEANLVISEPEDFSETAGKGVSARVNGARVLVGRGAWLRDMGVTLESLNAPELREIEGTSPFYVSKDGRCIGWVGVEDNARPDAKEATRELKDLGVRSITMFTGDRWSVARKVAAELGCTEVEAECLPEKKLELVNKLKEQGYYVAVVGDGVNDAPALAAGDIGVAMGAAGSDVAINSASVALMSNDLKRLPFLIRLSRKTRSVVYQNLAFGGIFIVAGLAMSGFGWFTAPLGLRSEYGPMLAAFLHIVSSFVVVFNSARLVRFGEHITPYHQPASE